MFWEILNAAKRRMQRSLLASLALIAALVTATRAHGAYISEIDLGGPGGQGVEFSQLDPGSVHTLVIMNAVATSTSGFGMVLDVIHLPAGSGVLDVAMVTDQPWPDNTATTIPLASTDASLPTLSLSQTRLLIVMQGDSAVRQFDNLLGEDPQPGYPHVLKYFS